MEPRKIETPVQSRGESQTSLPRQPERKRRFQLIKLEERIAPGHGKSKGTACFGVCGSGAGCH
jgi:hypothetical protein